MNIFVASNHDGELTGILLAESREKANLVWMGMGVNAHSIEEIDPNGNLGMHGVAILVTSAEYTHQGRTFIKCKRGS